METYSIEPMGRKKAYSVRLPTDTAEFVEEYCEEHDIGKADALRRFIERAQRQEELEEQMANGLLQRAQSTGRLRDVAIYGTLALVAITAAAQFGLV